MSANSMIAKGVRHINAVICAEGPRRGVVGPTFVYEPTALTQYVSKDRKLLDQTWVGAHPMTTYVSPLREGRRRAATCRCNLSRRLPCRPGTTAHAKRPECMPSR
ncbi:hypothetical protein EMEDMD4_910033 [Sinorhizobium medicae]|uniref:Uncharacterized protein n=1 Tax=Sinorhizobium medicae TaxID=110321 RepID=A0A508X7H1_9HYPH|nr:hypothetical protein EMEDMD4_910033 [Sinorhizobium medicae]